jgi:hypothetical protein
VFANSLEDGFTVSVFIVGIVFTTTYICAGRYGCTPPSCVSAPISMGIYNHHLRMKEARQMKLIDVSTHHYIHVYWNLFFVMFVRCSLLSIALFCFALHCFAVHCFALLSFALRCFALLRVPWHCFALLCVALLCLA